MVPGPAKLPTPDRQRQNQRRAYSRSKDARVSAEHCADQVKGNLGGPRSNKVLSLVSLDKAACLLSGRAGRRQYSPKGAPDSRCLMRSLCSVPTVSYSAVAKRRRLMFPVSKRPVCSVCQCCAVLCPGWRSVLRVLMTARCLVNVLAARVPPPFVYAICLLPFWCACWCLANARLGHDRISTFRPSSLALLGMCAKLFTAQD